MLTKLTIASAILSLASAHPVKNAILPRQSSAPIYPENGTLVDPPPVTKFTRPNPTYTDEQLLALKTAYTTAEKIGLLASYGSPNDYFKFDLTPNGSASNAANGLGGQGYLAFVQNYPVLIGTGVSVAIGYLNPCGLDSIHLHNRADELVTLVKGTSLKTGFVLEDGYDQPIYTEIGLYQTTIRPQGSLHWEFNDNCESAVFVAALSTEDPGVARTAQNFFINPQEVVDANLAYPKWLVDVNTAEYRTQLPTAFAQGAKACYDRCGIEYFTNQAGGGPNAPAPKEHVDLGLNDTSSS
ncbi:spherulin-1A [Paraphaeosphaeria sporulosa]